MYETISNYYDIELNENDKIIQQNENIKIKLKPHQLTSLYKAIDMENNGIINYKITNYNHIRIAAIINQYIDKFIKSKI